MSTVNRISAELSPESMERIFAAIDALQAELPFLLTLTPQERREMAKMGDKSVAFDEKCVSYMESHPQFLPAFINAEALRVDRTLRSQLLRVIAKFSPINTAMEDTVTALGADAWGADLAYYQTVREGAKRGQQGAQDILDDLGQRFPGTSRSTSRKGGKSAGSQG